MPTTTRPAFQPAFQLALAVVITATLTIVAYWPIGSNGFVGYDDDVALIQDSAISGGVGALLKDIGGVHGANYWQPLSALSLALDRTAFGATAAGVHAENVAWHLGCALLLLFLLFSITDRLGASTVVACLFAVHPVNVESVAWAVERRTVLAGFFGLCSVLAYVSWTRRGGWWRYTLILVFASASLLAKALVAALPLLLIAVDQVLGRRRWRDKGLVVAVCGVLTLVVLRSLSDVKETPLSLRLANATLLPFRHLEHLLWPTNLAVFYPFPATIPAWQIVLAVAGLVGISLAVLLLRRPYLAFGWLWFLACLVPTLGIRQAGVWGALADRHVYLAGIGIFVAVTWAAAEFLPRLHRRAAAIVAVASLSSLVVLSGRQVEVWRDAVSLFAHADTIGPESTHIRFAHGTALYFAGRYSEALPYLARAVELDPKFHEARVNMASALCVLGRSEDAIAQVAIVLQERPNHPEARAVLGSALMSQGRVTEGIMAYERALSINPSMPQAHIALGMAYADIGNRYRAAWHFREAMRLDPAYRDYARNVELLER